MMVVFVGGILGGETQGWTFIGLREHMKEGLFMSAHILSFEHEMIDICGEVLCQYGIERSEERCRE